MQSPANGWTAGDQGAILETSLLGPAWRWTRAKELAKTGGDFPPGAPDPDLQRIVEYLKLSAQGPDQRLRAQSTFPHIAAAIELGDQSTATDPLKILAIADGKPSEIAQHCNLPLETVLTWERLYFDVRPRLSGRSWIHTHVVRPEIDRGAGELAVRLKAALWGGLPAARAVLDADQRVNLPSAQRDYDLELKMQLKTQQALDLPLVTPRDALAFLKLRFDRDATTKRLELSRERFAHHCQVALEQQRRAEQRFAARVETEWRQRAERSRKAEGRAAARRARELRLETNREIWQAVLDAEELTNRARAAASPLSQLTWRTGGAAAVESVQENIEGNPAPGSQTPEEETCCTDRGESVDQAIHDLPTQWPDAEVPNSHELEFEELTVALSS